MKNLEHQEQKTLIEWADMQPLSRYVFKAGKIGDFLVACPNGGARSAITGAILKAEGVRAGFPDLFFCLPSSKWHGLFIEMKAQTKQARVSDAQKIWINRLNEAGYLAQVTYGFEEAKQLIEDYLTNKV